MRKYRSQTIILEEINRVRTENRIGKKHLRHRHRTSVVDASIRVIKRDTFAPPSSTRGGIAQNNGHNKLVRM